MSEPAFRRDPPPPVAEARQTEPPIFRTDLAPEVATALAALFNGKGNHPWGKSRGRKRGTSLV